ncbi:MAG: archaellin/type IV pilin N-terminal domain-containing protein, partial [Candidatus Heimdallarchaeaceae archaeon]
MLRKIHNKKGVSPVIATILILSLTIAATAVVFIVVLPMMRGTPELIIINVNETDANGNGLIDAFSLEIHNLGTEEAEIESINITQEGTTLDGWSLLMTSARVVPQSSSAIIQIETSVSTGEAKGLTNTYISIKTKEGIVFTQEIITTYHEPTSTGLGLVAIYNDTNYPTSWVTTSARDNIAAKMKDLLEQGQTKLLHNDVETNDDATYEAIYTATPFFVDANNLRGYMEHHEDGFIVMCSDVMPDTIFTGSAGDDEFVENWIEGGGTIMWIGDWPFYYSGHSDGSWSTIGSAGARQIFDTSSNIIVATNKQMQLTLRGEEVIPDFNPFYSLRPVDISILNSYGYTYDAFALSGTYADPVQFQPGTDANGTFIISYARYIDDSLVDQIAYVATQLAFNTLAEYTAPTIEVAVNDTLDMNGSGLVDTISATFTASRTTNILDASIIDPTTSSVIGSIKGTTPFYIGVTETYVELELTQELDINDQFKISVDIDYNFDQIKDTEFVSDIYTVQQISRMDVAIFSSINYANSWVTNDAESYIASTMYDYLTTNGVEAKIVDASLLESYMESNKTGIIILTGNVPPSNIFAGESDGSLLETWIANGGTCIVPGDWMFYYYADGSSLVTLGSSGERRILNT